MEIDTGYAIGGQTGITSDDSKIVWKIVTYDDTSVDNQTKYENANYDKNLYCLDAGKGFQTDNSLYTSNIVTYDYSKNMFTDRSEIITKWNSNKKQVNKNGEEGKITERIYNQILWIIDNMYVPTDNEQINANQKDTLFNKVTMQYSSNSNNTTLKEYIEDNDVEFTDELIEVVQQLAIWYYTNSDNMAYHPDLNQKQIITTATQNEGENQFENLSNELQNCTDALFKYLIKNAQEDYARDEATLSYATIATFWAKNDDDTNQPVVDIQRQPKQFDLSLRKRITKIEKTDGTMQDLAVDRIMANMSKAFYAQTIEAVAKIRNIQIDTNKLDNGDKTTAEYKHRKDPVTIDTGDKVTYTITIYNEGDIAGRAIEVTDQLPTGLKFLKDKTEETYADENYEYEYIENENKIIIKEKQGTQHENLSAYKKDGKLDSTDIHLICEVNAQREDEQKILTNIAWISKDSAPDGITDRDSKPSDIPTFDKNNMENYKGKTPENKELSDENYYYPGYQDDDDFDKLVLPSQEKIFDLALRKYITKVETINEDGTRTTTNMEEKDTTTRTPNIDKTTLSTGTTATYKHRKDPVLVKTGDLVTYNITVYNEGEKQGRATEIIDQLPTGLTFNQEETLNLNDNTGYTFTYNNENNTITITETTQQRDLTTYNTDNQELDSKTIKVVCNVVEQPSDKEKILTNIAWINKAYNQEDSIEITNQRYPADKKADRDSEPYTHPNSTQQQLNTQDVGYTGKTNYTKEGLADKNTYYEGYQDDDDFEKVKLLPSEYDFALRKFITQVSSKGTVKDITNREPQVDTSTIVSTGTATYNHPKDPVSVRVGDIVTYTIRVYNEGGLNGYVGQITDHLPEWLEFISEKTAVTEEEKQAADFNSDYLWIQSEDGKTITTDITSEEKSDIYSTLTGITRTDTLLQAFDGGDKLDYLDVKVKCKVKPVASGMKITNIADITKMENEEGEEIPEDRDSWTNPGVNIPSDSELPSYKDDQIEEGKEYIPGDQDDDDFEKVIVQIFDLALRKFITAVDDEAVTTRYPQVNYDAETGKMTFNHPKDAVEVAHGNVVTYTIRVYNQGDIAGYASQVTDNLPEGLLFLPENSINQKYRWKMIDENGNETENVEEAVYITTDYLSKEQGEIAQRDNLINAFNKNAPISNTNPNYKDIEVAFEVIEPSTSERILTNTAQISEDEDENGNPIDDVDSIPHNDEEYDFENEDQNEDDIDFDRVRLTYFDLALRKFITAVDETQVNNRYPSLSQDENGEIKYNHTKEPVGVANGNIVTYTIRVYNEGTQNGYAAEITDDLPEGLLYLPENTTNQEYRWKMIDENGNKTDDVEEAVKITTDYLSKEQEEQTGRTNLLKAFDKEKGITGENPDYKDVKIAFEVIEPNSSDRILVNIAQISEDEDEKGKPVEDIDSTPGNDKEGEDDIDKEYVELKEFDLALRKFITSVNDTPVNNRYPSLSIDENGQIKYDHTKTPVDVENGNIVTYTIRVYNEGEMNGYANEVTDDLPEGLLYLPESTTNQEYRWKMIDSQGNETNDVEKAVKITTDYLSIEQEKETGRNNLLKAFDKEKGITDENPDYKDVKIAFKVTEPNTSDRILVNTAQISEDKDENGKPVEDIDSTPGNDKEGEDDIDKEYVKVKYFDLALKKWVSQAIVIDGKDQTVIETGHTGEENPEPPVKVDIKENKLNSITVKFVYQIKVTNEGEIAGYAKEVKDHIPEGLEFVQEDNPDWYQTEDGCVATAQLENVLLQPGESASVTIVLRWINDSENLGQKVNFAEISKDYNESNTPDIDSKPNNFKDTPKEDDEDQAPVLLGIQTGTAQIYIGLGLIITITLAGGIILIKKYVL